MLHSATGGRISERCGGVNIKVVFDGGAKREKITQRKKCTEIENLYHELRLLHLEVHNTSLKKDARQKKKGKKTSNCYRKKNGV